MTSQHADEVRFERKRFALTAVDGTGLFDPTAHGLEPSFISTACYRGHVCRYAVVRRRLVLRDLELGSEDEPAPVGGVRPREGEYGSWLYDGLDLPVAYDYSWPGRPTAWPPPAARRRPEA